MSIVGGLPFVQSDVIYWPVPRFSLPLEEDHRVWSSEFQFRNKTISVKGPTYKNLEVPEGWIGLICVNTCNYKYRDDLRYRFGFINTANSFTKTCDAEWIEESGVKGYFKVPKFYFKECLTLEGQRQVHRLQLFCEAVFKQNRKIENTLSVFLSTTISIPNEGATGIRNSSSCKERNLEEFQNEDNQSKSPVPLTKNNSETKSIPQEGNWNCVFCTYTNSAKRSKCKICRFDKTAEDKNQVTTQTPVQATKKKERKDRHSRKFSNKSDDVEYTRMKYLEKLSQNFMDLFIKGKDTDLTINVKFREFKAHKVILRARSSVFDAMFSHEMSESKTGVLPIEDCESAVFEEFLLFIYGGRINLSCDNACEMYYLADKYDIPELKEECIHFLKKSLSTETICDAICLSTKYNEKELLNIAIDFFARNTEEILVTVKWQLFMKENPTEANELTIQALKLGFTKRKF